MSKITPRGERRARIATLSIVGAYVFMLTAAIVDDAVWLTVLIPAGLGCLALGVLIWTVAVIREAKSKGVL